MGYSNFKDPLGLLKRMIKSRNKIAYYVIFRECLSLVLTPLDLLLSVKEKKILTKEGPYPDLPIILVLGGSRSGTTLLYQTLVHYLPVAYINNFIGSFTKSPITAYKLFQKRLPQPVKEFRSYFGSVYGNSGANDAFFLWNRWLGEDRNHVPASISVDKVADMQAFFGNWLRTTGKPFLNKNNRNSLCASLLSETLPNVYFVEIYRSPKPVVQSLIKSRREVQGSHETGWGLLSVDQAQSGDPLGYVDDVCKQVKLVNQAIERERKKIDPKRYLRISFEDFCENPYQLVQNVSQMAFGCQTNSEELKQLKFTANSNINGLTEAELERVKVYFN